VTTLVDRLEERELLKESVEVIPNLVKDTLVEGGVKLYASYRVNSKWDKNAIAAPIANILREAVSFIYSLTLI